MIQARIAKRFPPQPDSAAFSLEIELQASAGVMALFGPSGAGKTLTLDAIAGFMRPDAGRIMLNGGSDPEKQVDYAFRLCLARPPAKLERQRLISLYQQQLKSFEKDPAAAEKLLSQGSAERPANLEVRKLAAWMMVGNVLLNLDETITKE